MEPMFSQVGLTTIHLQRRDREPKSVLGSAEYRTVLGDLDRL